MVTLDGWWQTAAKSAKERGKEEGLCTTAIRKNRRTRSHNEVDQRRREGGEAWYNGNEKKKMRGWGGLQQTRPNAVGRR